VYALGATIYTLLAGRSPFEQPGGRNGAADLIQRIETAPLAPLDRADVPPSLQQVLARAMSKSPAARFDSAVAFARALQRVQIELAHSVTPIDILDDSPDAEQEEDADGELTRVRGIVSIEPTTAPPAGSTRRKGAPEASSPFAPAASGSPFAPSAPDETVLRPSARTEQDATVRRPRTVEPLADQTMRRAAAAPAVAAGEVSPEAAPAAPAGVVTDDPEATRSPARSRSWLWIALGGVAAALVVAVVVVASLLQPTAPAEPAASETPSSAPQDPLAGFVPRVGDLAGAVAGTDVVFTWTNPDPAEGDSYLWYPVTLEGTSTPQRVEGETVTIPADPSGRTCIEVQLVRANGGAGDAVRGCTP
jgi:hypothetical protein